MASKHFPSVLAVLDAHAVSVVLDCRDVPVEFNRRNHEINPVRECIIKILPGTLVGGVLL